MSTMAAVLERGMDFEQIRETLPQQFPLIMLDRVTHIDPGTRSVALKNVTGNEFHFMGHFPRLAIMPGVLIIEAAAQAVLDARNTFPASTLGFHCLRRASCSAP